MSLVRKIQWGLEFLAYRTLESLLRLLPIPQVCLVGALLGRLGYRFLKARRQVVVRNLRIAFGENLSLGEIRVLARCVFARTGANLLSSLRTPDISSAELEEILEIRNLDTLLRLVDEGKGVILLTPHMGNWELLAQLIYWLPEGAELGTHYRPLHNPYVDARVARQRSERGTRLFAKQDSPHAMAAFLRRGGTLGILADQRTGAAGFLCNYYGRLSSCSPLPEILARRTGAAVVSISLESRAPGKWRCTFQQISDTSTPSCMLAMEEATRASPADVFWFQDRWRLKRKMPFITDGKMHRSVDPELETKPRRFLVVLTASDQALPARPATLVPMTQLEVAHPTPSPPPSYPDAPWSRAWPVDPDIQPEAYDRILRSIDESDTLPIDGIVLAREIPPVQRAARRAGILCAVVPPSSGA